jgi:hypothetical protein
MQTDDDAVPDKLISRTIIPAETGWTIVRYSNGGLCHPEHIIAWAIEYWEGEWADRVAEKDRDGPMRSYYLVTPITCEGAATLSRQKFAIREPNNGWYIHAYDAAFKNKSDLIAHFQEWERIETEMDESELP